MDKEKIKIRQKEKALKRFEQELLARERIISIVEKYLTEREDDLKKHLLQHGMSIVKDEDAVFFME